MWVYATYSPCFHTFLLGLDLTFKLENIVYKLKCQVFFFSQTCASILSSIKNRGNTQAAQYLYGDSFKTKITCGLPIQNHFQTLDMENTCVYMCHVEIPSGIKTWYRTEAWLSKAAITVLTQREPKRRIQLDTFETPWSVLFCSRRFLVCPWLTMIELE